MSKQFIDRMSSSFKPELVRSNAKEVKFAHNDSGFRLYTAGSPEAGRGTTPTILHCSECSFWQSDEKILAGLFQQLFKISLGRRLWNIIDVAVLFTYCTMS